jgi:hypothetical protein
MVVDFRNVLFKDVLFCELPGRAKQRRDVGDHRYRTFN